MRLAMVAADYTPGEADQLRRDMATWRSHGPIEQHREKLVTRMVAKGIAPEFAERVFQQIKGFGEYGFPESHAASFALIAYATSWLKCHHPDVFTCALLNAQPMGFYSSGTIVEDAKRHGIPILPLDVSVSSWDCTLEAVLRDGGADRSAPGSALRPAGSLGPLARVARSGPVDTSVASPPPMGVRMGLRYVKGLRREVAERIVAMRPYRDIADLYRRARCRSRRSLLWPSAGRWRGMNRKDGGRFGWCMGSVGGIGPSNCCCRYRKWQRPCCRSWGGSTP